MEEHDYTQQKLENTGHNRKGKMMRNIAIIKK